MARQISRNLLFCRIMKISFLIIPDILFTSFDYQQHQLVEADPVNYQIAVFFLAGVFITYQYLAAVLVLAVGYDIFLIDAFLKFMGTFRL